jgi:PAS domain S-box-containing protein
MNFNIFLRRSLKARVSLFTLIIFLVSIWVLAFYTSNYLRQDMQHMLSDQQFSTISLLAAEVNDELETRMEALKKISEQITSATLANPVALQTLLEQRVVFQTLFNGGTFVTGIDGVVIASVPVSTGRIGVSYMEREHISAALKEGKTSISKPLIGKTSMTPVFGMVTPIRNFEGKVMGALVGVIELSKHNFIDLITQSRYGKTGDYFLVAPQYRLIVTSSDKTRIMQQLPAPSINPTLDPFIQGYEGSAVYVNPLGIEVLGSAKGIPVAGWYMGAILPTAEAFAPIHSMQQHILLSTILVTLLAGGLTWWILSRQLAPMLVAARILDTQSDTNQPMKPLPIANPDEIGRLIGGFNHLLNNLTQREEEIRRSRDELEIRVQKRTVDLAKTVEILRERAELLDLAHDAILVRDSDSIIKYWNSGAEKTYGWTKEETLGKKSHDLLQTQFPIPLEDIVLSTLNTGQWEGELKHVTKDGTPIVVDSRWGVHKNLDGDLLGTLEINRDITERIKMTEERDRLIDDLQKALANVEVLNGLLPICASCKKIRDDKGYWNQIEAYISNHSKAQFSHGLCPDCARKLYPDLDVDFGPMLEDKQAHK